MEHGVLYGMKEPGLNTREEELLTLSWTDQETKEGEIIWLVVLRTLPAVF